MLRAAYVVVTATLCVIGAVRVGRWATSEPVAALATARPAATATTSPPATPVPPAFKSGPVVTYRQARSTPVDAGAPAVPARSWTWDQLADCETGVWGPGKVPVAGSARWTATRGVYQGGLQFDARTWDHYRDRLFPDFPADAQDASRNQQIVVAERVLADQGARAWPTCGPRIGMTGDPSATVTLPVAGPPDEIDDDLAG
jgi:hypothetical protein